MDTKQPNALRLADALGRAPKWQQLQAAAELRRQHAEIETLRSKLKTLEDLGPAGDDVQILRMGYAAARLEIESLQARIQELGQMARECSDRKVVQLESALAMHVRSGKDWAMRVEALERTITTLRAHIASLNAQVAAEEKAMRELESANSAALQLDARIKELEGQLDAVGAGGVEPLRKRECLHKIAEPDHFRGATKMVQVAAPVVLPAPDVFAKVSHKGAAKWDVEFAWPVGAFEEDGDHKLYTEQQVRAMLAAAPKPPAREPLTPSQVKEILKEAGYENSPAQERADFINGIRHGEIAHGITAAQKGDAHGQPT